MSFLEQPTPFAFFTGKGGVGKTSLACATAIRLADAGKRTLLVSTDPASNLDEMFGVKLSGAPTGVPGIDRLFAANIVRGRLDGGADRPAARGTRRRLHDGDRGLR